MFRKKGNYGGVVGIGADVNVFIFSVVVGFNAISPLWWNFTLLKNHFFTMHFLRRFPRTVLECASVAFL